MVELMAPQRSVAPKTSPVGLSVSSAAFSDLVVNQ
jgi:hypothetical protein